MVDHENYGVTFELYNFIDEIWDLYTIDRFAIHLNSMLPRYNSLFLNANSEANEAFTQDWFLGTNRIVCFHS